jgi:hypothetical protein
MTDDTTELSRRRLLGSLGAIGAVSAFAGAGTAGHLSDAEDLAGNALTAGAFDLKVDWAEHYADRSPDETDGLEQPLLSVDGDPAAVPDGYVGLPTPDDPVVAVAASDRERYAANIATEAYPDVDDDGLQDAFAARPGETTGDGVGYVCVDGADAPEDLDPVEGLRTRADDTYDEASGRARPLVAVEDAKPGDFGVVTLSYHLCDNPGYVWLTGDLFENAENGVTDPEVDAPGEDDRPGDEATAGELLDAIRVAVWYDDGDGALGPTGQSVTAVETTSLRDLLGRVGGERGVRLCPGGVEPPSPVAVRETATHDSRHDTGETLVLPDGESHTVPRNPRADDFPSPLALKTEDTEDGSLDPSGTATYETDYGTVTVTTATRDGRQAVTGVDIDSDDYVVNRVVVKGGREGAAVYSYDNVDGDDDVTNDPALGVVACVDDALTTPNGQSVSHVSVFVTERPPETDCCFEASTDHYLGVAWWLPTDVGNEVQSDSVGFDLGFDAEQCRHNDPGRDA